MEAEVAINHVALVLFGPDLNDTTLNFISCAGKKLLSRKLKMCSIESAICAHGVFMSYYLINVFRFSALPTVCI